MPAVPSALRGLTAEVGMGSGVTPSLWPPETELKLEVGRAGEAAEAVLAQSLERQEAE